MFSPLRRWRQALRDWMVRTRDPALEAFDRRDNPEALAKFMADQNAAAGGRPVGNGGNTDNGGKTGNADKAKAGKAKAGKAKAKKNASPQAGEDQ